MAYEVTPIDAPASSANFPVPTVATLNFVGAGFTCSRGTGEQSNVITVRIDILAIGSVPWSDGATWSDGSNWAA